MDTLNRRKYHRMPSTGESAVYSSGVKLDCRVLDESIGGFRIAGVRLPVLPRNQPLTLEYRDESIDVFCANVERDADGSFTIGLQRVDTMETSKASSDLGDSCLNGSLDDVLATVSFSDELQNAAPSINGALINPFVDFGFQTRILCRILSVNPGAVLRIELLGQKQFDVAADKVLPMIESERRVQLEAEVSVQWLDEIYSQSTDSQVSPDVDSILEFEFGPNQVS